MSSSPTLLDKEDNDNSPVSSSAKDNNSTVVNSSGDKDFSWRKTSNTSSSPNLLAKGKTDDEVNALGDDDSSDENQGDTEEEAPTKAQVIHKEKSVRATHKKVVEVDIEEENHCLRRKHGRDSAGLIQWIALSKMLI